MRDLLVFCIVAASIPLTLRRPFIGLLVFTWLAYMRPQNLCWGFAREMRFSYYVGISMLVAWALVEVGRRNFTRWDVRTVAMGLLAVFVTLSLFQAGSQDPFVMTRYSEFMKIIVVTLFTVGQVQSRQRLRVILWTIALSLGFFGVKGGIHGILSGGVVIHRGPGGMLEDNNDFALALVMTLPLLLYLGAAESIRWLRHATTAAVLLCIITILLTHSRGGFLALCTVMMVFFWRSRRRYLGLLALLLLLVGFLNLTPQHVIDRILTIGTYQTDPSAGARLTSWAVARRMIADQPFFGVGIRNFRYEWWRYSGGLVDPGGSFAYVAHNSYLQIWAESGTFAFLCFTVVLLSSFWTLRKLRNRARGVKGAEWVFDYARMFEASLAGFVVGAIFLNRGHFDLVYHIFGLITAFNLIALRVFVPGERRVRGMEESPTLALAGQISTAVTGFPQTRLPRWGR
ncbi:MAG: putative O-glycosylation ligase, exosortase A system-associated [Planctomycetota bacterium]